MPNKREEAALITIEIHSNDDGIDNIVLDLEAFDGPTTKEVMQHIVEHLKKLTESQSIVRDITLLR